MDANNQEYNFNESFALFNKNVLEIYKSQYPQLSPINCEENILKFNEESFQLGYFRLNQISVMVCELPANDFFNIVKLMAEIENNLMNEEYYLFTINGLIEKNNLSESEHSIIEQFVTKYLELKSYEDYLIGSPTVTLSKYRQIVNNVIYLSDPNNLSEAQKLITEKILTEDEAVGGRGNNLARVLKDPTIPNMAPDDDQTYSKAGFASIILILYSIINAAIILAIHFIK